MPFYGYFWNDVTSKDAAGVIGYDGVIRQYQKQGAADKDMVNEAYYNGRPTIRAKCRHIKKYKMGGIMIWDLLMDTSVEKLKLLTVIGEEMLLPQE